VSGKSLVCRTPSDRENPLSEGCFVKPFVLALPAATPPSEFFGGGGNILNLCLRASRFVTSTLTLYKGIRQVKVIDFVLAIKIAWQGNACLNHKEFFYW
jgi:hypothetical protein